MISIRILVITGEQSYPILKKVVEEIKYYEVDVVQAPVSISAFLNKSHVKDVLKKITLSNYDLVLLPGFVQWDSIELEKEFKVSVKKGPEFASDLPAIIKKLDSIDLSTTLPANKFLELTGESDYIEVCKEQCTKAKANLGPHTFYINEERSDIMIGRGLVPPIIAEIVNCTEKDDKNIIHKVKHYSDQGADMVDIGCVANKPNPARVKEIIDLIRKNVDILISVDSMDVEELKAGVEADADILLSLDIGSYKEFVDIPKNIPIVILPTNIKEGYFPRDPETRVQNLFQLTAELKKNGFKKLIADPLLETPIAPGLCNSLETYFLYKRKVASKENAEMELPLFFGISNVVELMDIDSVGINGLLASIAVELDIGILFTVEHSTKLMNGVSELKESVKLNYISKYRKTPPINQGIQVFRAKGKTSQELLTVDEQNAILVEKMDLPYIPDEKGYFKLHVDHYFQQIWVLFYSNQDILLKALLGTNAESLSKEIIKLKLTQDVSHLNYLGRELSKAEFCLFSGKPYIQDH